MKLALGTTLFIFLLIPFSHAQNKANSVATAPDVTSAAPLSASAPFVFHATPAQEAALKSQILRIHPDVVPSRVVFLEHWKYLNTARTFHLHVPTGYSSPMFTHLPSRTIFVDNDRYLGEEWLGYWIAHELGHLKANSASESDAERSAREFRRRLKDAPEHLAEPPPSSAKSGQYALAQGGETGPPSGPPAVTVQPDRKDVPVDYIVIGATPRQEALLRNQILAMQPKVLPRRVIFAPHWKYLDDCRLFHVRNRAGSGLMYAMFTHLPTLTVFIDNDRYGNDSALGFWIAHELGHMKTNNADEDAAEKAANVLRQRLKRISTE